MTEKTLTYIGLVLIAVCIGVVGYIGHLDVEQCVANGHSESYCLAILNP